MVELRDLVLRWQRGWGASRALPGAQEVGDGLRVPCMQPGREVEYFALDDDPAVLQHLAGLVAAEEATTWLTVATTDPARAAAALEEAGFVLLRAAERLMTADLATHPRRPVAAPYRLDVRAEPSCVSVTVTAPGDEPAAHGFAGLAGADMVADRILAAPEHRRRGLAAAVMGELAAASASSGAAHGLLIASEEGQQLYRALGWHDVAAVLIASPPGNTYPE
jgi:GNAT superfamily N-acetyltransferase